MLKELVTIPGNYKIRLFYLYPEIVTDELINLSNAQTIYERKEYIKDACLEEIKK